MKSAKLEILLGNYQEHIKFEKELSFIYPIDHPKRIKLIDETNKMIECINKLKDQK